jgi:hypothetical protein
VVPFKKSIAHELSKMEVPCQGPSIIVAFFESKEYAIESIPTSEKCHSSVVAESLAPTAVPEQKRKCHG